MAIQILAVKLPADPEDGPEVTQLRNFDDVAAASAVGTAKAEFVALPHDGFLCCRVVSDRDELPINHRAGGLLLALGIGHGREIRGDAYIVGNYRPDGTSKAAPDVYRSLFSAG